MKMKIEEFTEQLRISVDSKIKMIEHNMEKVIMPYIPNVDSNNKSDNNGKNMLPTFASDKLYNEQLFAIIENYTSRVCRLMFIRSKITKENAVRVSKILDSEAYMDWDKKELRAFFGIITAYNESESGFSNTSKHQSDTNYPKPGNH